MFYFFVIANGNLDFNFTSTIYCYVSEYSNSATIVHDRRGSREPQPDLTAPAAAVNMALTFNVKITLCNWL